MSYLLATASIVVCLSASFSDESIAQCILSSPPYLMSNTFIQKHSWLITVVDMNVIFHRQCNSSNF